MPGSIGSLLIDLDDLTLPHDLVKKPTELGPFPQTVALVSHLLDSFSPKAPVQEFEKLQNLDLRQNLSGVLNGFNRLRKVLVKWLHESGSNLGPGDDRVPIQFLTHVHRFCVSKSASAALLSDVSLTSAWLQCLGGLLGPSVIHGLTNLQGTLGKFLEEVAELTNRSKLFEHQTRELLLPVIVDHGHQEQSNKPIEACLLVNIDIVSWLWDLQLNLYS